MALNSPTNVDAVLIARVHAALFFVLLEVWLVSFVHSGNTSVLRGEFSVPNNQKPLPETGVNMI